MALVTIQDVLARLKSVEQRGGGQYMANCPCHDDKKASLAVRMGDKGIVFKCLAGCETKDIVAALGFKMADMFVEDTQKTIGKATGKSTTPKPKTAPKGDAEVPQNAGAVPAKKLFPVDASVKVGGDYVRKQENKETGHKEEVREKITREYVYTDKDGKPLIKVFRTEAKSFPVIHCVEGKWYWGDGGIAHWLYRLPDVIKAVKGKQTVYVVEGEKDAETLAALGFCATSNKGGAGKGNWDAAATEPLKGAKVVLIPDLDEAGRKYGRAVVRALRDAAEEIRVIDLKRAGLELLEHADISDCVALVGNESGKTLVERLTKDAPIVHKRVDDSAYAEYFEDVPGCKVERGRILAPYKEAYLPLCNFVALPIEETTLDDGGDTWIRLKIAGWSATGQRLPDATVRVDEFGAMNWVMKAWALAACIEPGASTKDKLRAIIQKAGNLNAVRRTVYAHTGWRVVEGRPVFLHAGGAIGAEDVGVELQFGFSKLYDLTGLAEGALGDSVDTLGKRQFAMSYTLRCLGIAGKHVGVPMVGFMFLSPLRHFLAQGGYPPAFIPFLRGRGGAGKSVYASLVLNHFGRFGLQTMPASFEDTANGISLKAYALKDVPLLVDDYHPESNPVKKRAMDSVAQQVSRMIGDGARRSRMKSDATGQTDKPARGTAFETGEQLPDISYSGVSRLYVIDVAKGQVPLGSGELNDLQAWARKGVLAETMRGYIEWLIPQYDELAELLTARYEALREQANALAGDDHKRIPSALAHLMLGIEMLLKYAVSIDMMSAEDVPRLMEEYWAVVVENSGKQGAEMVDEKPTTMYLETLRELLISERCHVVDFNGKVIPRAPAPGMIGYKDEQFYYFIPSLAMGAVQKVYQDQGQIFPLGKTMVARMLCEEKRLIPDTKTGKNVRQLKRQGVHAWFQWIPRHVIDGGTPEPEQVTFEQVIDSDNPFTGEEAKGDG